LEALKLKMGHVTLITPILRVICHPYAVSCVCFTRTKVNISTDTEHRAGLSVIAELLVQFTHNNFILCVHLPFCHCCNCVLSVIKYIVFFSCYVMLCYSRMAIPRTVYSVIYVMMFGIPLK